MNWVNKVESVVSLFWRPGYKLLFFCRSRYIAIHVSAVVAVQSCSFAGRIV
jgi:hypothetical protein